MGQFFRLATNVLLYEPSHRQDSTYHDLSYKSRREMDGTRNMSMGPCDDPLNHEWTIIKGTIS